MKREEVERDGGGQWAICFCMQQEQNNEMNATKTGRKKAAKKGAEEG